MTERKKRPRLSPKVLSLEQAEILARGQRGYQDIRDWLQVVYGAGYHLARTTS